MNLLVLKFLIGFLATAANKLVLKSQRYVCDDKQNCDINYIDIHKNINMVIHERKLIFA